MKWELKDNEFVKVRPDANGFEIIACRDSTESMGWNVDSEMFTTHIHRELWASYFDTAIFVCFYAGIDGN